MDFYQNISNHDSWGQNDPAPGVNTVIFFGSLGTGMGPKELGKFAAFFIKLGIFKPTKLW